MAFAEDVEASARVGDMGAVLKACRQRMGRRKGRSDGSTGTFAMQEIRREAWPEHFATVSAGRGVAPEATQDPQGALGGGGGEREADGRPAGGMQTSNRHCGHAARTRTRRRRAHSGGQQARGIGLVGASLPDSAGNRSGTHNGGGRAGSRRVAGGVTVGAANPAMEEHFITPKRSDPQRRMF